MACATRSVEAQVRLGRKSVRRLRGQYVDCIASGDDAGVRRIRARLLNGYLPRLYAIYLENKKRKAGRLPLDRLPGLARELRVRRGASEPVAVDMLPKAGGGHRPIFKFGIRNRALQRLLRWVAEPLVLPRLLPNQFLFRGGRNVASLHVRRTLPRQRGHATELDIQSFYPSVDVEEVFRRLGFPEGLGLAVMDTARLNLVALDPTMRPHLSGCRRGLPQGASLSSLLAEFVVAEVLRTEPTGPAAIYADNLLLHGESRAEVEHAATSLKRAFARSPLGLFRLHEGPIRRLADGFEYLGYEHRRISGGIITRPSQRNLKRFVDVLRERMRESKGAAYASSWQGSFKLWGSLNRFAVLVWSGIRHAGRIRRRELRDMVAALDEPRFNLHWA